METTTKNELIATELLATIDEKAEVEIVNFDDQTSWIRWYLPDFSDNGNINLPKGNYKITNRVGSNVSIRLI